MSENEFFIQRSYDRSCVLAFFVVVNFTWTLMNIFVFIHFMKLLSNFIDERSFLKGSRERTFVVYTTNMVL